MKRLASGQLDRDAGGKKTKGGLAFYAKGLTVCKSLCSKESWHAAKQLVSEQHVGILSTVEDAAGPSVWIQGRVTLTANAAAFPHQVVQSNTPDKAFAAGQTVTVQICLNTSTGELLDADSSCCPGGFQPVLGSMCPCTAGLILSAAKQAAAPQQGQLNTLAGLPAWSGSTVQQVLAVQQSLHATLCLVPQPTCYTDGLGLPPWQYEDRISSSVKVHFASQRNANRMYGSVASRPSSDPEVLTALEDAQDDLPNNPWFGNASMHSTAAPAGFFDKAHSSSTGSKQVRQADGVIARDPLDAHVLLMMAEAGLPPQQLTRGAAAASEEAGVDGAGPGAASPADSTSAAVRQRQLLVGAVGQWLGMYGGNRISGYINRPKVVNTAFELLLGGASGAAGRPLSCVVLLLRGLWEYMHCHGLGRLLAKPLKLMLALRNALLVSAIPLWARCAVAAQLDAWESALLWQHAANPLEVTGGVGLVHLITQLREVKLVCLHHWDQPQLAALLTAAVAEQQQQQATPTGIAAGRPGSGNFGQGLASQRPAQHDDAGLPGSSTSMAGGSSSSGSAVTQAPTTWLLEPSSLLALRLLMLDAVGQSCAYLELAMAGGAWTEAIDRMLRSKERSQLLKAVSLLPRHITSLSERLGYMTKLVGLESLGAPEKLEVAARLLLDMRDALVGELKPIQVAPGRYSYTRRYDEPGPAYIGHLWEATLYSLAEGDKKPEPGRVGSRAQAASLWSSWSDFMKLFVKTAGQALFEVGRSSMKAYKQHLEDISDSPDASDSNASEPNKDAPRPAAASAAYAGTAGAGSSAAAGAGCAAPHKITISYNGRGIEIHLPPYGQYMGLGGLPSGLMDAAINQAAQHRGPGVPVVRFCPDCQGMHLVEQDEHSPPPSVTPQPGDPDWQLLDIDQQLFAGDANSTVLPPESRAGLKARGKTGYIEDAAVLAGYRKVQPVSCYPQLLPMCSLDALCLSTLSQAVMAHFDAGGLLDTSLPLTPLREMLSHGVVEMGPTAVRIQAALEVAVYTTIMSPPNVAVDQRDTFYRQLTYQLLAVGQRSLALLTARTRFKLCPGPKTAAELMEVATAAGAEAEAAAVDLILGKGLVREPDAKDKDDWAGGLDQQQQLLALQRPASRQRPWRPGMIGRFTAADPYMEMYEGLYEYDEPCGYEEPYGHDGPYGYSDDEEDPDETDSLELSKLMEAVRRGKMAASGPSSEEDMSEDEEAAHTARRATQQAQAQEDGAPQAGQDAAGQQGQPIEILSSEDNASNGGNADAAAQPAAADAAASAAPVNGTEAARRALQRLQEQQAASLAAAAQQADAQEQSLDTRELLGADAAEAIQLRDTASSSRSHAAAFAAAAGGAAGDGAAAAAAGGNAAGVLEAAVDAAMVRAQERRRRLLGMPFDDDSDMDADDEMMFEEEFAYRYMDLPRPVRDLPPAVLAPRPKPAASSSPHKAQASAAAAAGGGGGGDVGDDAGGDDGDDAAAAAGRSRKRSSLGSTGKRRRSASAELVIDPQQAAIVADLFGITSSSCAHPARTLRVHLRRLSGLQLWSVVRYAAGRGAAADSTRRLGLAAWMSDGSSSITTMHYGNPGDMLSWSPAAATHQAWLDSLKATRDMAPLAHMGLEPTEGRPVRDNSWCGFPSLNWSSFVAQERHISSSWQSSIQHHNTPDANLAWLLAVLNNSSSSSSSNSSNADGSGSDNSSRGGSEAPVGTGAGPSSSAGAGSSAAAAGSSGGAGSSSAAAAADINPYFIASASFTGARPGFVFKLGSQGVGYYRDTPPQWGLPALPGRQTAQQTAGDHLSQFVRTNLNVWGDLAPLRHPGPVVDTVPAAASTSAEQDLSGCAELLEQLAALSKGHRYGLPVLQLCHALLLSGCRSACLSLLPQALLPAAVGPRGVQPNSCMVAALQDILPAVHKHGDVALRVSAAVSHVLMTRQPLPTSVLQEPQVMEAIMTWWHGLLAALHTAPSDWSCGVMDAMAAHLQCHTSTVSDGWALVHRLLVRCILPALGAAHSGSLAVLKEPPMPAHKGFELLVQCEAVAKAHWALRLYLCRLCRASQLVPRLPAFGRLLNPALAAAVQQYLAGLGEADRPLADMAAWKANRRARGLTLSAARAKDWVAAVLIWLTGELTQTAGSTNGGAAAVTSSCSSSTQSNHQAELRDFLEALCAALAGWCGPELLPLALAMQQLQLQQPKPGFMGNSMQPTRHQQQQLSPSVLSLLQRSLLPAVGRADELTPSSCVKSGAYKSALRQLMKDEGMLQQLPAEDVRHLVLTYWYQEATPAALLTANELLLKMEGPGSAQSLQPPGAPGAPHMGIVPGGGVRDLYSAAAGLVTASSAGGLAGAARGAAAGTTLSGAAALCAALPQMHPALLEQLDLVPSRGGLEAAGLKYMQLQVHAGAGQFDQALESVFSASATSGAPAGPVGAADAASSSLSSQMEVADAVLSLLADNTANPNISALMSTGSYRALMSLEAARNCSPGSGEALLAPLSRSMTINLLRLQMWRLARNIVNRPPGIPMRVTSGPQFINHRPWQKTFNYGNMPAEPNWRDPRLVQQWANKPLSLLTSYLHEQTGEQMTAGQPAEAARQLCEVFQAQERALLWCVLHYAKLVTGLQLERDLRSLLTLDVRTHLGHLPVFLMGLGQVLKVDRGLMWAYCTFKGTALPSKVSRYINRNAHDQSSLHRYLVKSTIGELQAWKSYCLPWWSWDMGQKANQAAELADWLWWVCVSWPNTRRAAGAAATTEFGNVFV